MVVTSGKKFFLKELQIWWPESADAVVRLLSPDAFARIMQCEDAVADQLAPYAARRKSVQTILIDLSRTESELLADMGRTTRSWVLRRAEKIPHEIVVNEHLEEAQAFFQEFLRRKGFRGPLTPEEWKGCLEIADVFSVRHDGRIVAARAVMRDPPKRVRPMLAASAERGGAEENKLVGTLSRRLVWHEITHYKRLGYGFYDLGGFSMEGPLSGNAEYKSSFGGTTVTTNNLFLFRSALLRLGFRALFQLRRQVRLLRGRELGV